MVTWHYTGDVNPEYGGVWIDLDNWDDGYCTAVRVTDLDSACGFRGAVMVEHVIACGTDDSKRLREAMGCYGNPSLRGGSKESNRLYLAEALISYGHYDPDDSWDSYQRHHTEILQLEPDGDMKFDGWKADKKLRGGDLRGYIESVHLR